MRNILSRLSRKILNSPGTAAPSHRQLAGFGEWLVERGLVTRFQLFTALNLSFQEKCRIGDALVQLGAVDRAVVEKEVIPFKHYSTLLAA